MKERLDVMIVKQGLAPSREKAKSLIASGAVWVDGVQEQKAGRQIEEAARIEIRGETPAYVSRGGKKLEKAIAVFSISLENRVCADIGASTGGFTDCMLQNKAAKVFAIDVGHDQLAKKLLEDERVISMEGTNIRYVSPEDLGEPVSFVSVDVSFISLTLVLPVIRELLCEQGEAVCLVKPQFEAGREKVGKKGVVRDQKTHVQVLETIIAASCRQGFCVRQLDFSPIKGPEGNIEYLLHLQKCNAAQQMQTLAVIPKEVVANAHRELGAGSR